MTKHNMTGNKNQVPQRNLVSSLHRLVIASPPEQLVKHVPRARPPVDIIPDKNADRLHRWAPSAIGLNAPQDPLKKVGTAVDIPHGINSDTFRERRRYTTVSDARDHVSLSWVR